MNDPPLLLLTHNTHAHTHHIHIHTTHIHTLHALIHSHHTFPPPHKHIHHTHQHKDILNNTILSLFHGVCDFGRELGVRHYGDSVFDFEGGVGSDETWTAWNGKAPEIVEDESYCGRHSLYVS